MISAVVVLLPATVFSLWDAYEARRVAADVQDIVRRGEPVTLAGRPAVRNLTDEQREAARLYYGAAVLGSGVKSASIQPRVAGADMADIARRTRPATEILLQFAAGNRDASLAPALDAIYASANPAFDLLERAAALEFSAFPLDRPPYPMLFGDLKMLRALNAVRTDALAWRGDKGALSAHVASVRLERTVPSMWSRPATTGSLTLLLARSGWTDEEWRSLQAAYESVPDSSVEDLLSLRAQITESVWPDTFSQPQHLQRMRVDDRWERTPYLVMFLLRPWMTRQLHSELQIWRETIEAARQPWPQRREAVAALTTKYPRGKDHTRWLPGMPYPAAAVVLASETMPRAAAMVARNRTSAVAIAVERYRLTHAGALPANLEALVPEYLSSVPQDPFTGSPLRWTQTEKDYVVYSVGADGRDDRGDVAPYHPDADWSFRSTARDIGIALPLAPRH